MLTKSTQHSEAAKKYLIDWPSVNFFPPPSLNQTSVKVTIHGRCSYILLGALFLVEICNFLSDGVRICNTVFSHSAWKMACGQRHK